VLLVPTTLITFFSLLVLIASSILQAPFTSFSLLDLVTLTTFITITVVKVARDVSVHLLGFSII
jgi:uncharacterized membrane protein